MEPPRPQPRASRPVVVIPLEKMAEKGWTEACLRKAGARFYKKTMSWRVPEEAWPPDMEIKTVTVEEENTVEIVVVDASTQCDDFRPKFEYGVGPDEKVVERMMRYLRR